MIDSDIAVVEFLDNEEELKGKKKKKRRTVIKQSKIPVGIKKQKDEHDIIETLEIETMEEEEGIDVHIVFIQFNVNIYFY